jgi:hypothetical protein
MNISATTPIRISAFSFGVIWALILALPSDELIFPG